MLFYERASLVGGGGGGGEGVCVCVRGGTKALTESEEGKETPAPGAVRTAASLWPPFWLFDVFVLLVIRPPPPGTKEA